MAEQSAQNGVPVAAPGHPCLALVHRESTDPKRKGVWTPQQCGKVDAEKPMAYRGENWCCENHRKLVVEQGGQG